MHWLKIIQYIGGTGSGQSAIADDIVSAFGVTEFSEMGAFCFHANTFHIDILKFQKFNKNVNFIFLIFLYYFSSLSLFLRKFLIFQDKLFYILGVQSSLFGARVSDDSLARIYA